MVQSSIDVSIMVNSSLEEYLGFNRSFHNGYVFGDTYFCISKDGSKVIRRRLRL